MVVRAGLLVFAGLLMVVPFIAIGFASYATIVTSTYTVTTTITTDYSSSTLAQNFSFNGLLPDLVVWLIIIASLLFVGYIVFHELRDRLATLRG